MSTVRERVLDILDTSSLADPREVAEKILGDLTAKERRDALAEVLPEYVRVVMNVDRRRSASGADPAITHTEPKGVSPGSARWRQAAASILHQRIYAGEQWKLLRDLTRDDVLAVVEHRRLLAASCAAVADRYQALHDRMVRATATTVGDLPESVVEEILR